MQALARDFVEDTPKASAFLKTHLSLSQLRGLQLFRASYASASRNNTAYAIQVQIGDAPPEYLQVAPYLTVNNIKVLLFKEHGLPFEEQTLFFQSVLLEGHEDLAHLGVIEGSLLYVVLKKQYRRIGSASSTMKSVVLSTTNSEGFEIVDVTAPLPPFRIIVHRIMFAIQYLRRLDQLQEEHTRHVIWTHRPMLLTPDGDNVVESVRTKDGSVKLSALRQSLQIPHDLRSQSEIRTIKKWLAGVKYFFDCSLPDTSYNDIARHIVYTSYAPGDYVFREGDLGDSFYIVLSGSISVAASGQGLFATMRPGMSFGEIGLLRGSSGNRSGSALVNFEYSSTEVALVSREVFLRSILSYKQAMLADNEHHLSAIPCFASATKETTTHLSYLADVKHLDIHTTLLKKGDYVEQLYLLVKGEVKLTTSSLVTAKAPGGDVIETPIKVLVLRHAPAILGHEVCSANKGLCSTATIEALSACKLLALNKLALLRFVLCNHTILAAIHADYNILSAEITRRLDCARDYAASQIQHPPTPNLELEALDAFFSSALSTGEPSVVQPEVPSPIVNALLSPRAVPKPSGKRGKKPVHSFTTAFAKICRDHWHETLPHGDLLTYEEQTHYSSRPTASLSQEEQIVKLNCLVRGLARLPPVGVVLTAVTRNDGNDQFTFLDDSDGIAGS
ncbi:hypothetical protein ACHHYP_01200 [Achlya hypogyna]|uniref:Cyclic nucleotide-binding domain-containing protein n=1 Tax=Achlya hypogyna TaxID=1202772 RepID=A0A1V9ZTQ8_ACHHY|nr:hypothetical protein ACHHYP_01200 [Achlya hypogyna]